MHKHRKRVWRSFLQMIGDSLHEVHVFSTWWGKYGCRTGSKARSVLHGILLIMWPCMFVCAHMWQTAASLLIKWTGPQTLDRFPWHWSCDERGLCVYRRRHGMRDEFISFTRSDEIMGQKEDGNWHGVLTTLKGQWSEVNRVRMKIITVMFKGIICKGVNLVLNKLAPEHFVLCYRFVL